MGPRTGRVTTHLALLAFLAFVSLGLPDGLLGVAWPSLSDTLGVPLDALGPLVAFQAAGYLLSSFLTGRILRSLSVGSMLTVSAFAAAVALLGFAVTQAFFLLLAFGLLAGLAGGAVDAGLNAYGATRFSPKVLNWLHASFGVGTTLGPLIVTAVLSSGNVWRWSYVIVGSAQIALALVFLLTRGRWRDGVGAAAPSGTAVEVARTRDSLRRPAVWLGMLAFFVYAGVEVVTAQWSFSLMTLARGVPVTTAGILVSLFWASLLAGRVLFGFVADRVNLPAALRACIAASVVGALLFWLEPSRLLAHVGLLLIGFAIAPIFASLISLTPGRVGREHMANAVGFQLAASGLGGAGLTAAVGLAAGAFGLEVIGAAVALLCALMFVVYQLINPRADRRHL